MIWTSTVPEIQARKRELEDLMMGDVALATHRVYAHPIPDPGIPAPKIAQTRKEIINGPPDVSSMSAHYDWMQETIVTLVRALVGMGSLPPKGQAPPAGAIGTVFDGTFVYQVHMEQVAAALLGIFRADKGLLWQAIAHGDRCRRALNEGELVVKSPLGAESATSTTKRKFKTIGTESCAE